MVGILKGECLAFKTTYFIVCFGEKHSHADALEHFFPLKNAEINSYFLKGGDKGVNRASHHAEKTITLFGGSVSLVCTAVATCLSRRANAAHGQPYEIQSPSHRYDAPLSMTQRQSPSPHQHCRRWVERSRSLLHDICSPFHCRACRRSPGRQTRFGLWRLGLVKSSSWSDPTPYLVCAVSAYPRTHWVVSFYLI